MSKLDDLLDEFDIEEAAYKQVRASVLKDIENFLAAVLPKLDPYLRAGIAADSEAIAIAAGPVVGVVAGLVQDLGLTVVEKYFAK